ncbi:50S ribosomal protein L33 [Sulfidibacter corallicola]|uniref:50S ribosomal protein L33 n=1 Tax=Sulfidibacter corallicola TaxID=2818388 RepID=UPI001F031E11|nr:50S ribosomal protein L33 [Sulfidibacter corallicola]
MAKAKKGNRINIIVECTEARKQGLTPSRYSTSKSRRNTPSRLEIKKYNPFLRRHTVHKEVR